MTHTVQGRAPAATSETMFEVVPPQSTRQPGARKVVPLDGRGAQLNSTNTIDPRASKHSIEEDCCGPAFRKFVVILAVTAVAAGVIGLLVFLGKMGITWQGVGELPKQVALYMTLAGMGTAFICTILGIASYCIDSARHNSQEYRQIHEQLPVQEPIV